MTISIYISMPPSFHTSLWKIAYFYVRGSVSSFAGMCPAYFILRCNLYGTGPEIHRAR